MVEAVKPVADAEARVRALADHGSTLLVEAAAGTGKTSLLAGRLVLLMAAGVPPRSIAAITFTELAAAELAARIRRYTAELLEGRVPSGMAQALPDGLSAVQRSHLQNASECLDELGAATIHGFCQDIIRAHAIEARVDPGAQVIDADASDTLLRAVFDEWFRERMSSEAGPAEPAAVLARQDPSKVADTLWKLALFRLRHRSARAERTDWSRRPDTALRACVDDFRRWMSGVEQEGRTLAVLEQLETLAAFYEGCFAQAPSFEGLWALGHPPRVAAMRKDSCELLPLRTKGEWRRLVGNKLGEVRFAEATTHFSAAAAALRAVLGQVATALVETLSGELEGLLDAYAARKRAAAVLDFDDLLEQAACMLRAHGPVCAALGQRLLHIAVDEFQDTDPVQCEILFRLAARAPVARWQDCALRPGVLFLVGDPKQAIYRFRGAAAETYGQARAMVLRSQPDGLLHITANFRSRPAILGHVNRCFRGPLARHDYADLAPTVEDAPGGVHCVSRLVVRTPPQSRAREIREAEAAAVAGLCTRLLDGFHVRDDRCGMRALAPADIALLAPTGSELWIYERELQDRGLAVASQAGKGFWRRQEAQDLLALARTLADPADTLAFGALLRGPLVGMTDSSLLDVTATLPAHMGREARFDIRTPPALVGDPLARHTLELLQRLRRRAREATPHQLLAEAVDLLLVRAKLVQREPLRSTGALANVDVFLELARAYGVRGLARFAQDLDADWRAGKSVREGLPDMDGDAVALATMHGAKGLEWPVVITVNCASQFRRREPFVHRASDDTLHWLLGDVVPPGLAIAHEEERAGTAREREQLWYVACTRARDLLVLPQIEDAGANSWARVVDLAHAELPEVGSSYAGRSQARPQAAERNEQTAEVFAEQQATVEALSAPLDWLRPSDADGDRPEPAEATWTQGADLTAEPTVVGAGRVRGVVLHRLLEEVISGELTLAHDALESRARVLLSRSVGCSQQPQAAPLPGEMAATVLAAAAMPELSDIWPHLVPEAAVYAMVSDGPLARPLSGRADAVVLDGDGCAATVVDWKSDVSPGPAQLREHAEQLALYLAATGARRGAVVYLTQRTVRWVAAAVHGADCAAASQEDGRSMDRSWPRH